MKHAVRLSEADLRLPDHVLPAWPGELAAGLHVRRAPREGGEPALFVHGLGGSSTNWTDLMGLLTGRLECDAVDLPGFGHSPPPGDSRYTIGAHMRAVVRLLEHDGRYKGRGPVHLFGNSLGGAVVTRLAADRPDLVRSLTLVSPALPNLRPKRGSDPRLPLLLLPGLNALVSRQAAKRSPEQRARAVIDLCFADPRAIPAQRMQETIEEVRRRSALPHNDDAFTQSLRGLVASYLVRGPKSLWSRAARVQAPTLLVWGALDRLVDVALAPRAAATFPDARLLVLSDVGHVAQMERPELVARAVLGMLEDQERGATSERQVRRRPAAS